VPYDTTIFQLPCGARCARVNIRGAITAEEARAHLDRVDSPGGDLYRMPGLVLTQEMESITPEARRLFGKRPELDDEEPWVAAVMTNPMLRVVARFTMRVQGAKRSKLFATEEEALRWLDERVREDMERRAKATDSGPP
jgi:hypothetical protein